MSHYAVIQNRGKNSYSRKREKGLLVNKQITNLIEPHPRHLNNEDNEIHLLGLFWGLNRLM